MRQITIDCRTMRHPRCRDGSFRGATFRMLADLEKDDYIEIVEAVDLKGRPVRHHVQQVRSHAHGFNDITGRIFHVQNRYGRLIVLRIA